MAEVTISFSSSATGEWSIVAFTVDDNEATELIDMDYGHDRWRPNLKDLGAEYLRARQLLEDGRL